ncbi:MAG: 6-phosphofructokinase [Planctomycetes bacterium]|nr:6-phosphofructokinase [Planctomycetota bacterium]
MGKRCVAIMTGGGDAPGLNAVIRAVVKHGVSELGWRVIGIEDSLDGLLESPRRVHELGRESVRGILRLGGTILGTTNRGDPFAWGPDGKDRAAEIAPALRDLGCEGLIAIGGDGTLGIAARLAEQTGVKVLGVPKTIDNDIPGTEITFGFDTAAAFATEAVDRLHATAEAHDRVMVVEVMGRDTGHIAMHAGIAGGADVVLIPEIPFQWEPIVGKIQRRMAFRRHFSVVVVAEGATPVGCDPTRTAMPGSGRMNLGGIGQKVAEEIAQRAQVEARATVLGHLQRGGNPSAFDRVLATMMGSRAVEAIEEGRWGRMVALVNGGVTDVPLAEVVGQPPRRVNPTGSRVRTARGMGIVMGDEDE